MSAPSTPDNEAPTGADAEDTDTGAGAGLARFAQRRKLLAYQEGMARLGYAYGVDLRRARWLTASSVGNTLVRAVDRRWSALSQSLMDEGELLPADEAPTELLTLVDACMTLLRAPRPTLRLLGPEARARGRWPLTMGIGPTHGEVHWLVLDVEGLAELTPGQRAFFVGSALADLHCDHGVFAAAHLIAARRDGGLPTKALRAGLRPWSQVMAFTADRAGLLCAPDFATAIAALERAHALLGDPGRRWLPPHPALEQRKRALEEFEKSRIVARVRAARALEQGATPSLGDPEGVGGPAVAGVPDEAWSLARVDSRLTHRLGLF